MLKLLSVWGPFRCQRCKERRKHWEGRCLWDTETLLRTDFWCRSCFEELGLE
jgi:hypothetical protein